MGGLVETLASLITGRRQRAMQMEYLQTQSDLMKQQVKLEEKKVALAEKRQNLFDHLATGNLVAGLATGGTTPGGGLTPDIAPMDQAAPGPQGGGNSMLDAIQGAIKQTETGNQTDPYNARGSSGEFGAYQFMPQTWQGWSREAGQPPGVSLVPYPEVQDQIARTQMGKVLAQGGGPEQVARFWNAGSTTGKPTEGYLERFGANLRRQGTSDRTTLPQTIANGQMGSVSPQGVVGGRQYDMRDLAMRGMIKEYLGVDPGEQKYQMDVRGDYLHISDPRTGRYMGKIPVGQAMEYYDYVTKDASGAEYKTWGMRPKNPEAGGGGMGGVPSLNLGGGGQLSPDIAPSGAGPAAPPGGMTVQTQAPGIDATKAAQKVNAELGFKRVGEAASMIFRGGDVNNGAVQWETIMKSSAPMGGFGEGRIFNTKMRQSVRSFLRPESGANITDKEIDDAIVTYVPNAMDKVMGGKNADNIARTKMKDFAEYLQMLGNITDPEMQQQVIKGKVVLTKPPSAFGGEKLDPLKIR